MNIDRRNFVKKSVLVAGASSFLNSCKSQQAVAETQTKLNPYDKLKEITDKNLFDKPLDSSVFKNTETLKVGIVGLGGRGNGALRNILEADKNIKVWSVGDVKSTNYLKQKISNFKKYGERAQVSNSRIFSGFDAYKKVINSGVDIVILTSTPAFRPLHLRTAAEANKHIFAEKPLAIDAHGMRSIIESAKIIKQKKLCFLTGFVWRYTKSLQDVLSHLHNGDFGDIRTVYSQYLGGGRPNKLKNGKPIIKQSSLKTYLLKWQNYLELGGDSLIEQAIHGVDKIGWAMNYSRDFHCVANGGQARSYPSNTFDHFSVVYNYKDGRQGIMNSRQLPGTATGTEEKFVTTDGYGHLKGAFFNKKNKKVWQSKLSGKLGYVNEHKILISHLRAGKVFNDIEKSITSNGMAIMGRMAAYTGKKISWEQFIQSKEMVFDDKKSYKYSTPYKIRDLAIPGITKLI